MFRFHSPTIVRWSSPAVAVLALLLIALPARAQSVDRATDAVGRVDFDFPDAPAATVEVDLQEGMLSAMSGIGKAAIQGVIEGLIGEGQVEGAVQQSADHLQAAHEVFEIASNVVREVRVRVYDGLSEQAQNTRVSMVEHYQVKLTDWDSVVRVHDGDDVVVVSVLQDHGAIHGLFVIVSERDDLVMVNVVCELTPENVTQITRQATQIGMKFGLEELIEHAIERVNKR